jgi:serine/threonine protein kinase
LIIIIIIIFLLLRLRLSYFILNFTGGDLLELLLKSDQGLGWKFRLKIAKEAALAINYLHQNNFIHRDIKSSNILLNSEWSCKICDFGMAREVDLDTTQRMTICGTNEYMAPELLFDEENYSFEIDVFSFGMVLLEIIKRGKVGHDGFAERSPRSKFQLDEDLIRSMLPTDAPESLVVLALQCVSGKFIYTQTYTHMNICMDIYIYVDAYIFNDQCTKK